MKDAENKQSHGITCVQSSSGKTLLAVKLVAAAVTLLDIGRRHIQGAMFWIGQTDPAILDGSGAGHCSRLSVRQPKFAAFICYAAACAAIACAVVWARLRSRTPHMGSLQATRHPSLIIHKLRLLAALVADLST